MDETNDEKDKADKLNAKSQEQNDLDFDDAWITGDICGEDGSFALSPVQSI